MTNIKLKQGAPLLYTANPNIIYLRDGEVVVYRRNASPLYQCRYKLADGKWHRVSTRKASVENRLDSQFHLVWDATVPDSSFVYLGKSYSVPTTAQVWVKRSQPRARRSVLKLTQFDTWFELVEPQHSDFAIQRVGVRAGRIRIQDRLEFSPESHWFIRAHDPRVLGVFQSCDWDSVKWNTAGNPSISPGELAELWIQASARQGINITQKSSSELFEW